jgi:hypothetical protein
VKTFGDRRVLRPPERPKRDRRVDRGSLLYPTRGKGKSD